ncbi:hypothetical protein [Pasteurella canis]|uniref:hypothetical protein n=1 Tax=Pasteurella canis TaxID=753 RepID=UPI000D8D1CC6|nr:hypothetical protein [Pasteurella canis]SPY32748.1 metalloprotease [Pasteurella canis]
MVRHVKLARDRRRKKLQIKVMIFFSAILLIITGILLRDKEETADTVSTTVTTQAQENIPRSESSNLYSEVSVPTSRLN